MSNSKILVAILSLFLLTKATHAQTPKLKMAVAGVDVIGLEYSNALATTVVRNEMNKLDIYSVLEKYDVEYYLGDDAKRFERCLAMPCLIEMGKKLSVNYMLAVSIESYNNKFTLNFREVDVNAGIVSKSKTFDYISVKEQLAKMVEFSLKDMYEIKYNLDEKKVLTGQNAYESAINNPQDAISKVDGPRMGFAFFTGDAAKVLKASKADGGYDMYPFMFQFGYQFEQQYLNTGNFQGLFEFIPVISGMDQRRFIPSLNILHGMRNTKNGFEFAFGPNFSIIREAEGFYDGSGKWILKSNYDPAIHPQSPEFVNRLDSRGYAKIATGMVFAIGKTFRSGNLNIPVNVFVLPAKDNTRIGFSVGFNARKRTANKTASRAEY